MPLTRFKERSRGNKNETIKATIHKTAEKKRTNAHLLIDLVASGKLGAITSLILHAGKGNEIFSLVVKAKDAAFGFIKISWSPGFSPFYRLR